MISDSGCEKQGEYSCEWNEWKKWWLNCVTGWQLSPNAPHQPWEQSREEALEGLVDWLRGYNQILTPCERYEFEHPGYYDDYDEP